MDGVSVQAVRVIRAKAQGPRSSRQKPDHRRTCRVPRRPWSQAVRLQRRTPFEPPHRRSLGGETPRQEVLQRRQKGPRGSRIVREGGSRRMMPMVAFAGLFSHLPSLVMQSAGGSDGLRR